MEQEQESLTAELSPPDTVRMIQNVNTIIQVCGFAIYRRLILHVKLCVQTI